MFSFFFVNQKTAYEMRMSDWSSDVCSSVSLVAMRPNVEVVAMIGGKDYAASPFNRATQARRQPGSTFKLFVYLAALEDGWEPDDRIDNSAIETGSYRPKIGRAHV